eukprot:762602-Hanusia_phi.AAC.2
MGGGKGLHLSSVNNRRHLNRIRSRNGSRNNGLAPRTPYSRLASPALSSKTHSSKLNQQRQRSSSVSMPSKEVDQNVTHTWQERQCSQECMKNDLEPQRQAASLNACMYRSSSGLCGDASKDKSRATASSMSAPAHCPYCAHLQQADAPAETSALTTCPQPCAEA